MDKNGKPLTRRERRRRQNKKQPDETVLNKQNTIASNEAKMKPRKVQSLGRVVRRDTFTVPKTRNSKETPSSEETTKTYEVNKNNETNLIILSDPEESKNLTHTINKGSTSTESRNLTYQLDKHLDDSKQFTYDVAVSKPVIAAEEEKRPVPAPRTHKPPVSQSSEHLSSDTDEDVMEIELDDSKEKDDSGEKEDSSKTRVEEIKSGNLSSESDDSVEAVVLPKPVPRKRTSKTILSQKQELLKKSRSLEDIEKEELYPRDVKSATDVDVNSDESASRSDRKRKLLVGKSPEKENSNSDETSKSKPQSAKRPAMSDILDRKNKKKSASKMFSTMMRLERAKIPKISSILRELKEDVSKDGKNEQFSEEDRTDFQMDSPRIPESDHYGKIYVQNKNGFYVRTRDEVFRRTSLDEFGEDGDMEDSTIKTAVLFHKYWSRLMVCLHGVLAGFAFCHVVSVSAIIHHQHYEAKGFVDLYSYLALKIHFIFYALITLCLVSCLDRLDVGHLSRKHYESAGKLTSMWAITVLYLASLVLTFVNHRTEARFDAFQFGDVTEEKLWDVTVHPDIDSTLMTWYRVTWPRDVLVVLAWLMVSLTQYKDFLHLHLVNMIKYTEVKGEGDSNHKLRSVYLQ